MQVHATQQKIRISVLGIISVEIPDFMSANCLAIIEGMRSLYLDGFE